MHVPEPCRNSQQPRPRFFAEPTKPQLEWRRPQELLVCERRCDPSRAVEPPARRAAV